MAEAQWVLLQTGTRDDQWGEVQVQQEFVGGPTLPDSCAVQQTQLGAYKMSLEGSLPKAAIKDCMSSQLSKCVK